MALVKTMTEDNAQGRVAEVYGMFKKGAGRIPGPLFVLSASPELFRHYTNTFELWLKHPSLSRDLMACIRYLVSCEHGFPACIAFNEHILSAGGISEGELTEMRADFRKAPLEAKEIELLGFVLASIRDPSKITQNDVDKLRELGWADSDLVDATYHGAVLLTMSVLVGAFT